MKIQYNKKLVFLNKAITITNNSGVYGVLDKNNQKIYIGSSNHVKRRYYEHASYLRNNKHWIRELQERWNLFGKDNFEFLVLEECLNFEAREQFYLSNNLDKRYNKSENITGKGRKVSEEAKNKIREARKNQIIPKEVYQKVKENKLKSNPNYYRDLALTNRKKIICNETGEIFRDCHEAGEKFNVNYQKIWKKLNNITKNGSLKYTFSYLNE